MPPRLESYSRVKDILKTGEKPSAPMWLRLKNGQRLSDITPYTVIERTRPSPENTPVRTLVLYYLDTWGRADSIRVADIEGLNVTEGTGDYAGRLLLEFSYAKFLGTDMHSDYLEEQPRKVLVTELAYGVHGAHIDQQENPDFYVVGEDTQYSSKPQSERIRRFPLWRIDQVYGRPLQLTKMMKRYPHR